MDKDNKENKNEFEPVEPLDITRRKSPDPSAETSAPAGEPQPSPSGDAEPSGGAEPAADASAPAVPGPVRRGGRAGAVRKAAGEEGKEREEGETGKVRRGKSRRPQASSDAFRPHRAQHAVVSAADYAVRARQGADLSAQHLFHRSHRRDDHRRGRRLRVPAVHQGQHRPGI